jgi:hypothetical protein
MAMECLDRLFFEMQGYHELGTDLKQRRHLFVPNCRIRKENEDTREETSCSKASLTF